MQYIILDRDGVINHDPGSYVTSPQEWVPIPGSLEAMARLNRTGYRLIVVTNQAGLGARLFDIDTLHAIHDKLIAKLARLGGTVDAIFFCPHTASENCDCRKPRTGMYESIRKRLRIDLAEVPCVGDKATDMEAAISVGGQPMLVRTGYGEQQLRDKLIPKQIPVFDDLAAVAKHLCTR